MKITNVIILFTTFFVCLYVLTGTASTRCSKVGVYILDDIFGLNIKFISFLKASEKFKMDFFL